MIAKIWRKKEISFSNSHPIINLYKTDSSLSNACKMKSFDFDGREKKRPNSYLDLSHWNSIESFYRIQKWIIRIIHVHWFGWLNSTCVYVISALKINANNINNLGTDRKSSACLFSSQMPQSAKIPTTARERNMPKKNWMGEQYWRNLPVCEWARRRRAIHKSQPSKQQLLRYFCSQQTHIFLNWTIFFLWIPLSLLAPLLSQRSWSAT